MVMPPHRLKIVRLPRPLPIRRLRWRIRVGKRVNLKENLPKFGPADEAADGDSDEHSMDADSASKYEELIPGLAREVVVDFILTKLPWQTLYLVSSLNKAWRTVCRSGDVREARARRGITQTLVVVSHAYLDPKDRMLQGVALYDPARDAWHLLPPLPRFKGLISSGFECGVLNGEIYAIGCLSVDKAAAVSYKGIFRFDLGKCRGVWTQCASMNQSRYSAATFVKDGKMFIFGGRSEKDHMLDIAEVYSPADDSWSPIEKMKNPRCNHKCFRLEDSLYMCGGIFLSGWSPGPNAVTPSEVYGHIATAADSTEMYDFRTNSWSTVQNFAKGKQEGALFVTEGRLYHVSNHGMQVYEKSSNTWHVFPLHRWETQAPGEFRAAAVVDSTLFAVVVQRRDNSAYIGRNQALLNRDSIDAVPYQAEWSEFGASGCLNWKIMNCPHIFNFNCTVQTLEL